MEVFFARFYKMLTEEGAKLRLVEGFVPRSRTKARFLSFRDLIFSVRDPRGALASRYSSEGELQNCGWVEVGRWIAGSEVNLSVVIRL